MKRTKVILGTMVLGLGMAGAAWAQPAPNHDRDGARAVYSSGYRGDRDDAIRVRGDRDDRNAWQSPYVYGRGDGDRDDRVNQHAWRDDRDGRGSWNWGHSNMRRGDRDER